jgi:hypothetical protein
MFYDSEKDNERNGKLKLSNIEDLKNPPEKKTVIFIKGMLRMGKVLPKKYISFVMETSTQSKTDTVVQGLLGRMFGYEGTNENFKIYLPEKIINNGELNKYLDFTNSPHILPKKGMNLKDNSRNILKKQTIIPIYLTKNCKEKNKEKNIIKKFVKECFENNNYYNKNPLDVLIQIKELVNSIDLDKMKVRYINKNHKTYKNMTKTICESNKNRNPPTIIHPGCGVKDDEINIWVFHCDFEFENYKIQKGDIYIDARVEKQNIYRETIETTETTRREMFCQTHEDGTEIQANGGYFTPLPPSTKDNEDDMLNSLRDYIEDYNRPRRITSPPNCIRSNQTGDTKYKGIFVNENIFHSLNKGGRIYETIQKEFGFKLKTDRRGGKCKFIERGVVKLRKIEWIK